MNAFWNNIKTVLLMGGLTGLLVAVGSMLGKEYLLPFLGFSILMNLGAFFFSDKIAIATMRGREVTRANGGDLYELVDELRQRAALPMPRVYVCPHAAPNAFATGRSPSSAAVAVTEGALQMLNRQELAGVLAHELAHVKNRDTLISTMAAIISGVLATIAQYWFWLGSGRNSNSNPFIGFITVILAAVGAAVIKAMISRSREFVADAHGAAIAGSPDGLMSALEKLENVARRVPMNNPNPAMNNMFIVEPFMGGTLLKLFASHPPTRERIAALAELRGRL